MAYNTIVFSGGGSNGYVFTGVIKYLNENNILKLITSYYGTSIGSIYATLLAMNFSYEEIYEKLYNFNYEEHNNINKY